MQKILISLLIMMMSTSATYAKADAEKEDSVKVDKAAASKEDTEASTDEEDETPAPKKKPIVKAKKAEEEADEEGDDETVVVVKPAKKAAIKKEEKSAEKPLDKATKTAEKTAAPAAKVPSPSCPDKLDVSDQTLSKKVPDWGYFSDSSANYYLERVAVYANKAGKMTRVNPTRGTESMSGWTLTDNGKEKYFLVCSYTRTSLLLKKQLDASYKNCSVKFETTPRNQGAQTMTNFSCE